MRRGEAPALHRPIDDRESIAPRWKAELEGVPLEADETVLAWFAPDSTPTSTTRAPGRPHRLAD